MDMQRINDVHLEINDDAKYKKDSESSNEESECEPTIHPIVHRKVAKRDSAKYKTLADLIHPISPDLSLHDELRKLKYLSCFIGASSADTCKSVRVIGVMTWCLSLIIHFIYDGHEALTVYGFTFLTAQGIWFLSLLLITWGMSYKTLPWLVEGHKELRQDKCYEKTITRSLKLLRIYPYAIISFGMLAAGIQHSLLLADKALHLDFGFNVTLPVQVVLQGVRFLSGFHLYAGYALFWLVPTSIMLITGHSMAEFMDQMSIKMKDKERVLTFKEAISSYSKRAQFVKTSSNKSVIVLTILILIGILCFGLNAYVFLFGKRHYLHVWHSLLPLALLTYPLCTAAWVTKQYTWFIIVVVRAWVHRDDLDETSDEDSGIDDLENNDNKNNTPNVKIDIPSNSRHTFKKRFWGSLKELRLSSRRKSFNSQGTHEKIRRNNIKSTVNKNPDLFLWQNSNAMRLQGSRREGGRLSADNAFASAVNAVKAANKFRNSGKRPRFNFEKFLSYLESMRSVVGFHITGVVVTWDLVTTTLFLLFSVVAVFMQESIFGSKKSTS